MVLVTGSILARADSFEEVRRLSLEHVERSRLEPGCISHAVHVDCQDPMRLFFFEQWADEAALRAHFAVGDAELRQGAERPHRGDDRHAIYRAEAVTI